LERNKYNLTEFGTQIKRLIGKEIQWRQVHKEHDKGGRRSRWISGTNTGIKSNQCKKRARTWHNTAEQHTPHPSIASFLLTERNPLYFAFPDSFRTTLISPLRQPFHSFHCLFRFLSVSIFINTFNLLLISVNFIVKFVPFFFLFDSRFEILRCPAFVTGNFKIHVCMFVCSELHYDEL